jgi:hypothetical protein
MQNRDLRLRGRLDGSETAGGELEPIEITMHPQRRSG